jgi:hypothetical protein
MMLFFFILNTQNITFTNKSERKKNMVGTYEEKFSIISYHSFKKF